MFNFIKKLFSKGKASKKIKVIERRKGWGVYRDGASRASRLYEDKSEAIAFAHKMAKGAGIQVVINKADGSLRKFLFRNAASVVVTHDASRKVLKAGSDQPQMKYNHLVPSKTEIDELMKEKS